MLRCMLLLVPWSWKPESLNITACALQAPVACHGPEIRDPCEVGLSRNCRGTDTESVSMLRAGGIQQIRFLHTFMLNASMISKILLREISLSSSNSTALESEHTASNQGSFSGRDLIPERSRWTDLGLAYVEQVHYHKPFDRALGC